ncbi:hypothetical protein [Planomicrobium okeanokoites]|uniref:Uncharacterized protein n=1 Tax=Planomicrobium okeanokoites TaxID=244 RepID=A0ABV7KLP9_PLAOK|nr:hypothetical protein [Planomicrobium okeanokoites]TAA69279.1 hypothetical protein D2910_08035 [Planomicrobium okeanokoites]
MKWATLFQFFPAGKKKYPLTIKKEGFILNENAYYTENTKYIVDSTDKRDGMVYRQLKRSSKTSTAHLSFLGQN